MVLALFSLSVHVELLACFHSVTFAKIINGSSSASFFFLLSCLVLLVTDGIFIIPSATLQVFTHSISNETSQIKELVCLLLKPIYMKFKKTYIFEMLSVKTKNNFGSQYFTCMVTGAGSAFLALVLQLHT